MQSKQVVAFLLVLVVFVVASLAASRPEKKDTVPYGTCRKHNGGAFINCEACCDRLGGKVRKAPWQNGRFCRCAKVSFEVPRQVKKNKINSIEFLM